ncbi:hypothetical protein Syun_012653 [Stephania yunnanensis]|uniref:Uncharacterized protein n=1 Tax=Stephania yunnanensis TaxID=152371 RepID=A0AAP0K175_9MAGN
MIRRARERGKKEREKERRPAARQLDGSGELAEGRRWWLRRGSGCGRPPGDSPTRDRRGWRLARESGGRGLDGGKPERGGRPARSAASARLATSAGSARPRAPGTAWRAGWQSKVDTRGGSAMAAARAAVARR